MSTLADELLNDFEDSGSEGEQNEEGEEEAAQGMELDGDEEEVDEEMVEVEDEEEAKTKVEKMQLGHVNDVRSVAGLMKTLEPVLEVSHLPPQIQGLQNSDFWNRKLSTSNPSLQPRTLERSKITPNITSSLSLTLCPYPLTMKSFLSTSSSEITTQSDSPSSRPWSPTRWTMPRSSQLSEMALWMRKASRPCNSPKITLLESL